MLRKIKISFAVLSIFLTYARCVRSHDHDDDIHTVKYTADNFSDEVPKKNHFIMFYAPWCGHCQRLGPTWEQLAEMLNEDDSNIRIAKVDCTTDSSICSEHDVTGYPTLKFFRPGTSEGIKFRGTRDLPTLTTFINEQLREGDEDHGEVSKSPQPVSGLIELNEDNFDKHVASGKHFIKFYAPWCGHCQKLAPVWEQLAKSLEFENSINIEKLDCTQYRSICNQFEVKGYPTLLWIEDGKKVDKYQGDRSQEDLKAYVNKMLGSKEAVVKNKKPQLDEIAVGELNGNNFKHGIENGVTFVKFFAPWCGHCKRLAPTWEDLGKKFVGQANVNIVKVDCTLDVNKDLCSQQEVDGFPTIYLYKNGEKISEYNGSRTLEDLFNFVKQHLGHDEL